MRGPMFYPKTCVSCSNPFRTTDVNGERCTQCTEVSWQIATETISKLKAIINRGYGLTGKPLPPKRIERLKRTLAQLETDLTTK